MLLADSQWASGVYNYISNKIHYILCFINYCLTCRLRIHSTTTSSPSNLGTLNVHVENLISATPRSSLTSNKNIKEK